MSLGTYTAAGAAGLLAAEATGTTSFTPLGQQAREAGNDGGGGGGGPVINLPDQAGGPDLSELAAAFESVAGQQQGPNVGELAAAFSDVAQAGQQQMQEQGGPTAADLLTAFEKGAETAREKGEEAKEKAEETTEEAREKGEEVTETVLDPVNNFNEVMAGLEGDGLDLGLGGGGGAGLPDPFAGPSVLDQTERAGGQLKDAGGVLKETATEGGGTIWEAGSLLLTGEADTSDTWATDRGRITLGDAHPSNWSLPSRTFEEPDQTVSEMAVENVRSKVPSGGNNSNSSGGNDDAKLFEGGVFGNDEKKDDEPIISLPPGLTSGDSSRKSTTQGVR